MFFQSPIAHRANYGNGSVPENTLAAIQNAYNHGIKWVECDVKLTKDGEAIILHDDTLKRTTNAVGEDAEKSVAEMTYAEIYKYDSGGQKIPTLKQFLNLLQKLNMGLLLEIKPSKNLDIATAKKAVEVLNENNFNSSKLLVQSFSVESLREVKRLNPDLHLGLLIEDWDEKVDGYLRELKCTALVADEKLLNRENITKIKNEGIPCVLAWTVNTRERAKMNAIFSVKINSKSSG